jgi:hypothetical protein
MAYFFIQDKDINSRFTIGKESSMPVQTVRESGFKPLRFDIKMKTFRKNSLYLEIMVFNKVLKLNRKVFTVTAALLLLISARAQRGYRWEFGVATGASNYLGEIGGRDKAARPFISDMKLAKTRWNETVYARYRFDPLFAVKFAFNYLRIEADDKLTTNPGRRYRNLSFRNDIYDFETTIQWLFYSSNKPMGVYSRSNIFFTAYLFGGVGAFMHNPKTMYQGQWTSLQPVHTEGVEYSKFGYCLPFGAGFYVTVNKRKRSHRIGLEVNWRYTNTDYLDDISGAGPNKGWLSKETAPSSKAYELNNRNPELEKQPDGMSANYGWQGTDANGDPQNKAPRGDPSDKDSYISVNISYGVALKKSRGRFTKSKGRRIRTVSF